MVMDSNILSLFRKTEGTQGTLDRHVAWNG